MLRNNSYRFIFIGLLLWAQVFVAGLSVSPAQAASSKIGVIEIQKAVSSTKEFKREFTKFRSDFQKEKEVITAKEKNMKQMLEELNKQGFVLSPELKKKKEENFIKKKKEFDRYVQDRNEEFTRREKGAANKILQKMLVVIKKIGKEKKYTLILEKKGVFYSDDAVDLTAIATKIYDRVHK